ncbi:MAG: ferrous iron transporter B [Candidatus Eisenbacteria bacterium]|uniref:Ferrous iron transporter B n=1 Tax=Eiseniibacteriota bacterium TaxID=2212470 RepID=A0A948W4T0_UNCEI|nr:ferrous iron transporter B [Candidatus Eisenbacteria bacterium]MBU1949526.1 ferrous iron transporter B [Candidatus Eisenbacteria bacterium]MBU2692557.1 ferrous iron transporter B [Candidatus Eisenbacteria bacterium]
MKKSIESKSPNPPESTHSLLLVGQSNVGKSAIFGALTNRYVAVSNYPGTTVEVTQGVAKFKDRDATILDTPGTNSLLPMSNDERVTRDILMTHPTADIIQVGDGKNLSRTLHLTLELAEAGRSIVLVLNMLDEARARGIRIDTQKLHQQVGCPVVATVAIRRQGFRQLISTQPAPAHAVTAIQYPLVIEHAIADLEDLLPSDTGLTPRALALLILQSDESLADWLREKLSLEILGRLEGIRAVTERKAGRPLSEIIFNARNERVAAILDKCFQQTVQRTSGWSRRLGGWSSHPVKGLFILALILYFSFWFVGLLGAGTLVDLMETGLFGQAISPLAIKATDSILPFPHQHDVEETGWELKIPLTPQTSLPLGVGHKTEALQPTYTITGELTNLQKSFQILHDFLVGPFGLFTMALAYGFAIILPIVGTFFLLFSLMEDSGYLPRLAVMVNSLFRKMGLNGRAVLPLVLGLGCDTMATMSTRILSTSKQRIITTLLLALVIPCSAQLGVLLAMISRLTIYGALIWTATLLGILFGVGHLASKIIPGPPADFLMEIPPLRRPVLSNVFQKTGARIIWYLREVIPLFILGTFILFLFDKFQLLGWLHRMGAPVVEGVLGLPRETTEAFLIGFLRRDYGAVFLLDAATGPDAILNTAQVLTSMIVITLFVPCIANVFMIIKEFGFRVALIMMAFIFPFAFLVGGIIQRLVGWLGIPV